MSKVRIYTDDEIAKLLKNSNIERIESKSKIIYKNSFKLWAVKEKLNNGEKSARQIFKEAGFDINILDIKLPQQRLCDWILKYRQYGESYFINNTYSRQKDGNKNFFEYVKKKVNDPRFVAFIIDKDENDNLRFNTYLSVEDEKINNKIRR